LNLGLPAIQAQASTAILAKLPSVRRQKVAQQGVIHLNKSWAAEDTKQAQEWQKATEYCIVVIILKIVEVVMSGKMIAIEFQARVKDGTIEVPEQYRDQVNGDVRIIILRTDRQKKGKIIQRLLQQPLQDASFRPFTRNEIYDQQK
jgi:hypothetical protein